jgi:hypothetical protein
MGILSLMLVLAADEPVESLAKKMLPVYVREAAGYSMAVESDPKQELEFKKQPVFEWSNPTRNGVQQGVLFLWLRDGRPAALACIFSHPHDKLPGRKINHELHALDAEKLLVKRDEYNQWKPQAGLARSELPDAGAPAAPPAARLVQMRRLAQQFTGHEIDQQRKRWELRLLPTPLYRYPAAKAGVIDGALFALTSEAGTDPEVLLLLEAREHGGELRWEYVCCRFSDLELHVYRKGKEVWSRIPSETDRFTHDPLHLYRLYPEKVVTLEGKLLARYRQTPRGEQIMHVDEK